MKKPIAGTIIGVSDLHCGCKVGLYPSCGVVLDSPQGDAPVWQATTFQKTVWSWWEEFWNEWVPEVTRKEPYDVVLNGDCIDGRHHGSTTQISQNLADQVRIAAHVIEGIKKLPNIERLYIVRGTSAHVGEAGENEEMLAQMVGAEKRHGYHSRHDLWKLVGNKKGNALVHFNHHVGTASRAAYESSAVMAEMSESFVESGRWGRRSPDVIVRSHRHRNIEIRIPKKGGSAIGLVTPAWQGKTPFAYKVAGARQTEPQFGGCCIRWGTEYSEVYVVSKVWSIERDEPE